MLTKLWDWLFHRHEWKKIGVTRQTNIMQYADREDQQQFVIHTLSCKICGNLKFIKEPKC